MFEYKIAQLCYIRNRRIQHIGNHTEISELKKFIAYPIEKSQHLQTSRM